MKKRILVVEPYYGGSHKQFLTGLSKIIDADFTFLTLPARKWKMRMQLSAPWFFSCINKLENRYFDTILCSTFVDVAVLKALVIGSQSWNNDCVFCTYFHENQFAYPTQIVDKSLQQFTAINFTTALASDRLAFNSIYNRQTFLDSSAKYIKRAADIDLKDTLVQIKEKSTILYPGIDFNDFPCNTKRNNTIPVICWNHRWEHDKGPETFFEALYILEDLGCEFEIIVLGQSFRKNPVCFTKAKEHFCDKIIHFGFAKSKKEYISLLQQSDIVVSTALHEFYGISIIEAIRAGCIPLVPDRLSYPELYCEKFRYSEGDLVKRLAQYLEEIQKNKISDGTIDTNRFSWKELAGDYQKWLFDKEA
jgi:glycosyltransferase involved in cell wall biosynthesis